VSHLDDDPYETAAARGLECHVPKPYELFVDIDTPEDERHLREGIKILMNNGVAFKNIRYTMSRSSRPWWRFWTWRHQHVRIVFPRDVTDVERVLLQACLGSDRKRELLSWLRIEKRTGRPPTVFFEERAAHRRIVVREEEPCS
jgi:hypothetical protein